MLSAARHFWMNSVSNKSDWLSSNWRLISFIVIYKNMNASLLTFMNGCGIFAPNMHNLNARTTTMMTATRPASMGRVYEAMVVER